MVVVVGIVVVIVLVVEKGGILGAKEGLRLKTDSGSELCYKKASSLTFHRLTQKRNAATALQITVAIPTAIFLRILTLIVVSLSENGV